jgi:hypothetical protein
MAVPTLIHRMSVLALMLLISSGLAACDNPVEREEDHTIGLIVFQGQQEVARINIEANPAVTGRIQVAPNTSETFRVVALQEGGSQIPISGEYSLSVAVPETAIASATLQGADQIIVSGKARGTTALDLTLLHEGHPDFNRSIPPVGSGKSGTTPSGNSGTRDHLH